VLAGDIRQQLPSIELPLWLGNNACGSKRCRQDVQLDHGPIIYLSRRNVALPLHDPRHADASLPGLRLKTAQGTIARSSLARGAPVITDKENQRVLFQVALPQLLQHLAYGI